MTKAELVERMAAKTQLNKHLSAEVLGLFLQCITEALQAGDKVELRGFGSFRCRSRPGRQGRNPKADEVVDVPAKTVPVFKTGKALHERLNPQLTHSASRPVR